ncbi:MAG: hypothetical protein R3250_07505 [Melioribacteraceae bacterium]|nr:hypothetical protein [Melioribacteraceae bacterium]
MKNKLLDSEKFFSQLGHDLRGSFTSILGFSNILSDPNESFDENEVREFGKRISAQANESLELLVNFINWLKLEKYNSLLTIDKLNLSDVISEVSNSNRKQLDSLNVTPIHSLNDSNYVFIDYEILTSILNNIIIYLLRFSEENTELKFSSTMNNIFTNLTISITASKENIAILKDVNLSDPNSENAFPLIFAVKFIELCGGEFKLSFNDEEIAVVLAIPNK